MMGSEEVMDKENIEILFHIGIAHVRHCQFLKYFDNEGFTLYE